MSNKIKTALIVGSRPDLRVSIRESLKECGIECTLAGNFGDGFQLFKEYSYDWVFLHYATHERSTPYDFLTYDIYNINRKESIFSLYLGEEQTHFLPMCYELGLFSHHLLPFTQQQISIQIKDIIKTIESSENYKVEVPVKHIRDYFSSINAKDQLISLDKRLCTVFAANPQYLLSLAESYFTNEEPEMALEILDKLQYSQGDIHFAMKQLRDLIHQTHPEFAKQEEKSIAETFGIYHIAVIDPDITVSKQIQELAEKLGIERVSKFDRGDDAYKSFLKDPPQIIFCEWKVPGLTGLQLTQRLANHKELSAPMVIVSSQLRASDKVLLSELGISDVIEKPCSNNNVIQVLINLMTSDLTKDTKNLEARIQKAFIYKNVLEYSNLFSQYESLPYADQRKANFFQAQLLYLKKDYSGARTAIMMALKKNGDDVKVLDLLGKILLASGRHEEAQKCFEKAAKISPDNLFRICEMAENAANFDANDEAGELIEKAIKIDESNNIVAESSTKISLANGDVEKVKSMLTNHEMIQPLIAFMNNNAVLKVTSGHYEESIKLYSDALKSLPPSYSPEKTKIEYNLALAYIRNQEVDKALKILHSMKITEADVMYKRRENIIKTIEMSKANGTPVRLAAPGTLIKTTKKVERPFALHFSAGDHGLHLIFDATQEEFDEVKHLIKNKTNPKKQDKAN